MSPATNTSYTVTALSDANCISQAGDRSGTATVNVNARPTSVISATAAAICNGGSKTISIALTGSQPWSLTYTDGSTPVFVSGITSSPYSFSVSPTAASTTYTVTALSDISCSSLGGDRTGSAVVTVNPRPTSVISGTATICNGVSTPISIALTGAQPWSLTYFDGATSTSVTGITTSPYVINPSPATGRTYTITALSDANCTSIAGDRTGSAMITVNQPSVAPTALNASVSPICNGGNTTLTQTGGTLGTGAGWNWYSDAGYTVLVGTSAAANASLIVTPTTTITYYLRAEGTTSPCTSIVSGPIAGITITVNDPSIAATSLAATLSTICNGNNTTLTQTGGSLGTGASWKWYSNAGFTTLVGTSVAANASLTLSPAVTTTYYLRAESSTGAPCAANVAAGSVTVTVNQLPVINTQPSNVGICASNPASLSVVASGGAASYQWFKGTFPGTAVSNTAFITGAQTNILNFSQAFLADDGIYYVEVSGASP